VPRSGGHDVTVEHVDRSSIGEEVGMMSGLERIDVRYSSGTGRRA
jgi:hypothetical protein